MLASLLIIDDFLPDPLAARTRALALGYDRGAKAGNYPGVVSDGVLPLPGLDAAVSRLIGRPVVGAPGTLHGHVRMTLAREKGASGVHIDPAFYSGILFLSKPEDCRGGTDFFRHRRTGLDRVPDDRLQMVRSGYDDPNVLIEEVVNGDTLKPAKWERSFTAPMRFNRLLLFSPWMFHNSGPGFGDRPDNARLAYLMFFVERSG